MNWQIEKGFNWKCIILFNEYLFNFDWMSIELNEIFIFLILLSWYQHPWYWFIEILYRINSLALVFYGDSAEQHWIYSCVCVKSSNPLTWWTFMPSATSYLQLFYFDNDYFLWITNWWVHQLNKSMISYRIHCTKVILKMFISIENSFQESFWFPF